MIAADRDTITAGVGACKPDRAIERVGSVLAELDHIRPLYQGQKFLRAVDLQARRSCEIAAHRQCALYGFDDGRERVPERDRAQSHAVLDELVAIHVPDVA